MNSHPDTLRIFTLVLCAVYPAATPQYDNAHVNREGSGYGKMMNYDK